MTVLCGGGTSSPQVGVSAVVDYTAGLTATLLEAVESPWLIPVIPLLGLTPLVLSTFCATDPPAMSALTLAEATALLNAAIGTADFISGAAKFKDNVLNGAWTNFCKCNSGPQPTTPVAPAAPAGTQIYTPPATAGPGPCATSGPFTRVAGPSNTGGFQGNFHNWLGENITSYVMTVVNNVTTPPGYAINAHFEYLDPNGSTSDNTHFVSVAPGATSITTWPFNPALTTVEANWTIGAGSGANSFVTTIDTYCNGNVPGGASGCCPPDPATQGTLDAILAMVTLIQRQQVPFGYVAGTAHAGLSGNGSFAIQGLVGLSFAFTTTPSNIGQELGTPLQLQTDSYMSVGTTDGYVRDMRISHSPQLWFPPDMGALTLVGYTLQPGAVGTITELSREP